MAIEAEFSLALPGFRLEVALEAGRDCLGILGASGCGKSLTLKCIAGIIRPDSGRIAIDGRVVFDRGHRGRGLHVPPRDRRVGYLFQQYALFPTMTVRQNLDIVMKNTPPRERAERIRGILDTFRLHGLEDRKPSQLSGGQQQRAALARLLLSDPAAILLDEPFSALDSSLRHHMEQEVQDVLDGFAGARIFVSHDRDEVYRLCPRIMVMEKGRVEAQGDREALFQSPGTVAAAALSGCRNITAFTAAGNRTIALPAWGMVVDAGRPVPEGCTHAGLRAHHLRPCREGDAHAHPFRVERVVLSPFSRTEYLTPLMPEGYPALGNVHPGSIQRESPRDPAGDALSGGSTVWYALDPEHLLFLRDR